MRDGLCEAQRALLLEYVAATGGTLHMFSGQCRDELAKLLGSAEAAQLAEAMCALRGYTDAARWRKRHRQVLRLLRAQGVVYEPGKRAHHVMQEFTAQLTSVALAAGIPIASGEHSRLVRFLRRVADEIGLRGDPRTELRRVMREDQRQREDTRRWFAGAIARCQRNLHA